MINQSPFRYLFIYLFITAIEHRKKSEIGIMSLEIYKIKIKIKIYGLGKSEWRSIWSRRKQQGKSKSKMQITTKKELLNPEKQEYAKPQAAPAQPSPAMKQIVDSITNPKPQGPRSLSLAAQQKILLCIPTYTLSRWQHY